ncbi:MAG: RDD family protein [Planctomycetota bacterium]|nr:RDD family protein [Planctomycetota bacterium]
MLDPHEPVFNPYAAPRAEIVVPTAVFANESRQPIARLAERLGAALAEVLGALCAVGVVFTLVAIGVAFFDPASLVRDRGDTKLIFLLALGMTFANALFVVPALGDSSSRQASYGKRSAGFKVVRRDGGRIGFALALARCVVKLILLPLAPISFVMMILDPQRRALHDWICGTRVVEA